MAKTRNQRTQKSIREIEKDDTNGADVESFARRRSKVSSTSSASDVVTSVKKMKRTKASKQAQSMPRKKADEDETRPRRAGDRVMDTKMSQMMEAARPWFLDQGSSRKPFMKQSPVKTSDPTTELDEKVMSDMDRIARDIEDAIHQLLHVFSIRGSHPVHFDSEVTLPRKLEDLLQTLIPGSINFLRGDFADFLASQTQLQVDIMMILRALLGAAVMRWCLKPLPQGKEFWTDNRVLLQVADSFSESKTKAQIKNEFLRRYLTEHVNSLIGDKAATMPLDFDRLLRFILPCASSRSNTAIVSGTHFFENNASTAEDLKLPQRSILDWHKSWMEQLIRVFETALRWRSDTEKAGHGELRYGFEFPMFKDEYRREGKPDGQVILGLMPRIETSQLDAENWLVATESWDTIYQGKFIGGNLFERRNSGEHGDSQKDSDADENIASNSS